MSRAVPTPVAAGTTDSRTDGSLNAAAASGGVIVSNPSPGSRQRSNSSNPASVATSSASSAPSVVSSIPSGPNTFACRNSSIGVPVTRRTSSPRIQPYVSVW